MVDIGHRQTDEVLERLEKRLAEEYAQAYKDVEKKAADYFKRFEVKDKQKKALVDAGKLTEKEYQTWRRNQMLSGKRWTDLRDQLAKDLTNTNQIAAGIVRGKLNEVFAINANYSEYMIENGMRTNYGFTLYDRNTVANLVANDPDIIPWKPEVDIPADLRWNRQMITSHITQGILQGESIPNLSKRLLKTVNNDKVAAVRTARTAVTSSQNAGRQMVYDRAKRMGLKLQKEWLATLDGRTRHEHGAVDGQRVPLDGKFTVGGYKMKFPGDMSAPAHLVYNCRCTTITVEPDYITKGEEPRKTYREWQAEKNSNSEPKVQNITHEKERKVYGKIGSGNYSVSLNDNVTLRYERRVQVQGEWESKFGVKETIKIDKNDSNTECVIIGVKSGAKEFMDFDATNNTILTNGRVCLNRSSANSDPRLIARYIVENEIDILAGIREDGIFYRVTDNKKEADIIRSGRIRKSKNHMTGEEEDGLSVWETPKYYGNYMEKIKGDVVGIGSDGEPLLDIKSVELISVNGEKIEKMREVGRKKFMSIYGWTEEQLDAILHARAKIIR